MRRGHRSLTQEGTLAFPQGACGWVCILEWPVLAHVCVLAGACWCTHLTLCGGSVLVHMCVLAGQCVGTHVCPKRAVLAHTRVLAGLGC